MTPFLAYFVSVTCFNGKGYKVHFLKFHSLFPSDAWQRRLPSSPRRRGLLVDDNDFKPADLNNNKFAEELPKGESSSLFD